MADRGRIAPLGMNHPTSLFFYGTLRYAPICEIVLGRAPGSFSHAVLSDHRVARASHLDLPVLTPQNGSKVAGLLAENLTETEIERLDFYEGGFDYWLEDVTVETGSGPVRTKAYYAPSVERDSTVDWDFERWLTNWGDMTLLAAEEVMALFGRIDPVTLQRRFPQIRMRAASAIRARDMPSGGTDLTSEDIEVNKRRRPYAEFFALEELDLKFRQFDGRQSAEVTRACFLSADAVTVLPYDPVRNRVLLIEQLRVGPFGRGDTRPWQFEPVAGRIDPGETPDQAARRETVEEAGVTLRDLVKISQYYPSPGAMTEYLFSYVGLCDLPDEAARIGGVEHEAEDIRGHLMTYDELQRFVADGRASNGPLILTAFWLAQNRDRLRSGD